MHDLVVVGGGLAGLVATLYAVRKRLNVLLVTETLGGKTEMRAEFPEIADTGVIRASEVVERFKNELRYLDVVHRLDRVSHVRRQEGGGKLLAFEVQTQGGETLEARSVVIASGCRFEPPAVPGASTPSQRRTFCAVNRPRGYHWYLSVSPPAFRLRSGSRSLFSADS